MDIVSHTILKLLYHINYRKSILQCNLFCLLIAILGAL